MNRQRRIARRVLFLAALCLWAERPLFADTIEILSLAPSAPATLNGIPAPPPGTPIGPTTSSNSVTIVVRYQLDSGSAHVEVGPSGFPVGAAGLGFVGVPPWGPVAPCGATIVPSEGECAVAFALLCRETSPASITIDQVRAQLGVGVDVILATDASPASYTFRCPGAPPPPPRSSNDCLVLGVAGFPKPTALPFGSDLPICRCLQDQGAREFRCALLHPDFLMVRRVPIPVAAGQAFAETWEFLALTGLDGPVTMAVSGGGLSTPVRHAFGVAGQLEPGMVERFVIQGVVPADGAGAAGVAAIEYQTKGAGAGAVPTFGMERTFPDAVAPQTR
jgi:hypothetical protein